MGLEKEGTGRLARYTLKHLQRYPLGTSYPAIVADVLRLLGRPELFPGTPLVVDGTGVGRAVVDQFKPALGRRLVPVTITAGDQVTESEGYWRVPKRELVGIVQVLLQTGRLLFAARLPLVEILTRELLAFQVKIDPMTAHDSYGSWREGTHDDCVLALALACWYGEQRLTRPGTMPVGFGIKLPMKASSNFPYSSNRSRMLRGRR